MPTQLRTISATLVLTEKQLCQPVLNSIYGRKTTICTLKLCFLQIWSNKYYAPCIYIVVPPHSLLALPKLQVPSYKWVKPTNRIKQCNSTGSTCKQEYQSRKLFYSVVLIYLVPTALCNNIIGSDRINQKTFSQSNRHSNAIMANLE